MSKELELFNSFLKKKNLKVTKQREELLKIFLNTRKHLSVEEFYNIAKKRDHRIGLATAFRTLKLLKEMGIAKEVLLGDKIIRYERKYGHGHHDHLVCTDCGKCIEAVDPKIEELQDTLCKRFGFKPERHRMEIFGLCKKCR
ncbi:MAG: Fur family transcriptional regulator [Candidatus Omnitrophota bacterium]